MYIENCSGERCRPVRRARRPYRPEILLRRRERVISSVPVRRDMR